MANLTTIPLQDSFDTTLTQELSAAGLTINVAGTPDFTFQSGETTYITLSPGQTNKEVVEVESYDSSAKTITIASGGRNQSQGDTVTTTAQVHTVGSKAIISDNYAFWNDIQTSIATKVNTDEDTTITANIDFTADSAVTTFRTPNMTTTARDTVASPLNGMLIYNTTDGENQMYDGGAWQAIGTSSVPNASVTVAGIVEEATDAEVGAGTATGTTGARTFINAGSCVKTSSGAGDENKVPVLNASGELAGGFIDGTALLTDAGVTATNTEINQVCDGTTATAANLNSLTDASDAQLLHTHFIVASTADDVAFASASAQDSHSNASYTKAKDVTIGHAGTYNIRFDMWMTGGTTVEGKVYKNGSPIGTERQTSSGTAVEYNESFAFVEGDLVQLYSKATGGGQVTTDDFEVRGTLVPGGTFTVNLN